MIFDRRPVGAAVWRTLGLLLAAGCLLLSLFSCTTGATVRLSGVSLLSGVSAGGIVENSGTSGIEGAGDADSISGATEPGYNGGVHAEWEWKNHHAETGFDYIGFAQSVDYDLPGFGVEGRRDFRFHQIRMPLTYNLHLLKNMESDPGLILKAGLSGGYTFHESIEDSGSLAEYRFSRWDFGPTLGAAVYPFPEGKAFRMGFYLDFYRGSRIFEDIYHQEEGLGGQSYMKLGVTIETRE